MSTDSKWTRALSPKAQRRVTSLCESRIRRVIEKTSILSRKSSKVPIWGTTKATAMKMTKRKRV